MPSTDTTVQLSLPRRYVGQILDGIELLIEKWEPTADHSVRPFQLLGLESH